VGADRCDIVEIDIAYDDGLTVRCLDPVDTDIYDNGSLSHHLLFDEEWFTHGGDENVGRAADFL